MHTFCFKHLGDFILTLSRGLEEEDSGSDEEKSDSSDDDSSEDSFLAHPLRLIPSIRI